MIFSTLSSQPSANRLLSSQPQTRLRLRIFAPDSVGITRALEELRACCGILLQAAPARYLTRQAPLSTSSLAFDLDLQGPINSIQQALRQLQTFPVTIQGRANPDGDGWHC
ncbi:hypothetical protein [Pseudanabaena sp. FACHB-2040]|uniref:hypothetical protein n=1 Tax=Pseudanabaena sp. FACHB-2040 TaxID=2692859 RepID=UPI001684FDCC|nr:hypothetical protein [Pseudanabaena sp. FACHB-2040]MBD2259483.1 hypothetical protein [Pseudanabaena sp. FACHB-2040]